MRLDSVDRHVELRGDLALGQLGGQVAQDGQLAGSDPEQASALWSALDAVQDGLGGGNEVVGGVWLLLVSVAALRTGVLPRRLNQLGVLTAAAGLVTVVPGLSDVGLVFGLGLIGWFAWVGVTLLREGRGPADGQRR